MLNLNRKCRERVYIGDHTVLTICSIRTSNGQETVRIGFESTERITRGEFVGRKRKESINAIAAKSDEIDKSFKQAAQPKIIYKRRRRSDATIL